MREAILHICSYYSGQRLYGNLIRKISNAGISQHIYVPVRTSREIGRYQINDIADLSYHYAHILKPWHRLLYFVKIRKTFAVLQKNTDISSFKLTHAHSLFSDGGIALKLHKKFGIPFIVAIRNTDLNVFLKKMPHLRSFAREILRNAKYVVFINPTYKEQLFDRYIPKDEWRVLLPKCVCIPNGIEDFWHVNYGTAKRFERGKLHLLYVGTFIKRKHLPLTIEAAKRLSRKCDVVLTVIGGGGNAGVAEGDEEVLRSLDAAKNSNLKLDLVGKLYDYEKLKDYYRKADIFVMPSKNETFGLVYIEALSQGTPIIYTRNDGVGGLFDEGEVGYGVKSFSAEEIEKGIERILDDYEAISQRCIEASANYNWDDLTMKYLNLYNA